MDALKKMSTIWPSAGRAWELFEGSTVNTEATFPTLTSPLYPRQPTRKRSAEGDGEDSTRALSYADTVASSTRYDAYALDGGAEPYFAADQAAAAAFDRWAAGEQGGYVGQPLSTSVLPQQYSTGLTQAHRRSAPSDGAVQSTHAPTAFEASNPTPQYWNDYSTLGQLGLGYSSLGQGQQQRRAQVSSVQQQPQYMPQHYNMFSTSSSSAMYSALVL